ncbi:hypothetical protein [Nostoc sp.]
MTDRYHDTGVPTLLVVGLQRNCPSASKVIPLFSDACSKEDIK